jgi:hypothetical protein
VGHGDGTDCVSAHEESSSSEASSEEAANAHSSGDESSHTYYLGTSMITIGWIREMMDKGYFAEGDACEPRE